MPAEESSNPRRNDHMQQVPGNGYQQNGSGYYRPPTNNNAFREREPSRSSGSGGLNRVEPRQYSPPPRSEPPRSYTPPPRQEPRSQPQPSRAAPSNHNNGGGNNGGGNRGGNRPWNTPKER